MEPKETAMRLYHEGLEHARRSDWGAAATCFRRAVVLDAESPAAESLAMIESIQNYYYKENFNP